METYNQSSMETSPPIPLMSPIIKSTFGSMENFGSCGSSIFIVILLIILAIIGYILYINKDTIKIPTLHQRIANFGRQIKSIKRM